MVDLTKVEQKAPALVSFAKEAGVSLEKRNLVGTRAKVAVVLDYSGSMSREYSSGSMQRLVEKLLGLASQLDDDGDVDFFVFDTEAAFLGEISLDDYEGSVARLTNGRRMGTTNYAAAFKAVANHYGYTEAPAKKGFFGKKAAATGGPSALPVFAIFLTDGAPNSRPEAEKELKALSAHPVFWKFLSIGNESIPFLEKLDDMSGRVIDNADYKPVGNVDNLATGVLMDHLLDEYDSFLKEARSAGMLQ